MMEAIISISEEDDERDVMRMVCRDVEKVTLPCPAGLLQMSLYVQHRTSPARSAPITTKTVLLYKFETSTSQTGLSGGP